MSVGAIVCIAIVVLCLAFGGKNIFKNNGGNSGSGGSRGPKNSGSQGGSGSIE